MKVCSRVEYCRRYHKEVDGEISCLTLYSCNIYVVLTLTRSASFSRENRPLDDYSHFLRLKSLSNMQVKGQGSVS